MATVFKIAGNKTNEDWHSLRGRIDAGDDASWVEAADDFYFERLRTRYLLPLDLLQKGSLGRGEGFSIMAIQCSLIEFLESTYLGTNYVYRMARPPHEYSASGKVFISFLTKRLPFAAIFDEPSANSFYIGVRCGILHEAATTGGWRVKKSLSSGAIADVDRRLVFHEGFREGLEQFISAYRAELSKSYERQRALVRKFDRLALG